MTHQDTDTVQAEGGDELYLRRYSATLSKYLALAQMVQKIADAHGKGWKDTLNFAILDAVEMIKPAPSDLMLTQDEEEEILARPAALSTQELEVDDAVEIVANTIKFSSVRDPDELARRIIAALAQKAPAQVEWEESQK